jgi:hypothetical protein
LVDSDHYDEAIAVVGAIGGTSVPQNGQNEQQHQINGIKPAVAGMKLAVAVIRPAEAAVKSAGEGGEVR